MCLKVKDPFGRTMPRPAMLFFKDISCSSAFLQELPWIKEWILISNFVQICAEGSPTCIRLHRLYHPIIKMSMLKRKVWVFITLLDSSTIKKSWLRKLINWNRQDTIKITELNNLTKIKVRHFFKSCSASV